MISSDIQLRENKWFSRNLSMGVSQHKYCFIFFRMTVTERKRINPDCFEIQPCRRGRDRDTFFFFFKKGGDDKLMIGKFCFLPQGDETIHTLLCKLISLSVNSVF